MSESEKLEHGHNCAKREALRAAVARCVTITATASNGRVVPGPRVWGRGESRHAAADRAMANALRLFGVGGDK